MRINLGKLEQHLLLQNHPLVSKHLPDTAPYTKESLIDFAGRYPVVFIKHNTSGQGRGVYKLTKTSADLYSLKGYSLQGKEVDQTLDIHSIHKLLQPFERFGRTQPYIVQQGINSISARGQHVNIRVHVQHVEGKPVVGGIYGSIAYEENGITNICRGAYAMPMRNLFFIFLKVKKEDQPAILNKLMEVSAAAAEIIASHYPCRECGVDLGLDENMKPYIFEVNITPGIEDFARIDKQMWKQIIENRKKIGESTRHPSASAGETKKESPFFQPRTLSSFLKFFHLR
ncbi:YheC/YheD family protein [Domibacillus indicus]|uniref:YheC/YheD family protein n=1 Tax=Domibacillus indicus TaxID=1437523 RepID=UPI0006183014|nr:YheC/YheD family protein [Domibacillus indicus]